MLPVPPAPNKLHCSVAVTPDGSAAVCTPNGVFTPLPAEALAAAAKPALASVARLVASVCELLSVAVGVLVGDGTVAGVAAGAGAGVVAGAGAGVGAGVGVAAGAGAGVGAGVGVAAGAGAGLVEVAGAGVELELPPPQAARLETATAANNWLRVVFVMEVGLMKMMNAG